MLTARRLLSASRASGRILAPNRFKYGINRWFSAVNSQTENTGIDKKIANLQNTVFPPEFQDVWDDVT